MFRLPRNALNFAVAGLIVVAAFTTPASSYEMVQKTGSVGPYEPILTTVGNKHVNAFFVPGDDHCNCRWWCGIPMTCKPTQPVAFGLA